MRTFQQAKAVVGARFGRLKLLKHWGANWCGKARWLVLCDCGTYTFVSQSNLVTGHIRSCGCFQKECARKQETTHGDSKSVEWRCWSLLKNRCLNSRSADYPDYGGRGITVCDRWKQSYENFLSDMGRKPSSKHSIDRIDVNGNYDSANCRWATPIEQANNKRRNTHV